LPNSKVLVSGGWILGAGNVTLATASAELYDPVNGTWSATGALITARGYHSATMLQNGKVLITAGKTPVIPYLPASELYF
jgi:hypothetical protein